MLNCILRSNPNAKFMYVVDTRPRINAMANRAAGKGYENENFYENINGIESSGWLKHVKAVLDTSLFISQAIQEGVSVVVHCSDGWDRTAQVCSLAGIFLDPYYRTIQGFQELQEVDERGASENGGSSEGVSPCGGGATTSSMTVEQLSLEVQSVALEWKTLRNVRECSCSTPFDTFSRK
ncbi:hypothetical protein B566_EDAN019041, partial [Ephemera danica]